MLIIHGLGLHVVIVSCVVSGVQEVAAARTICEPGMLLMGTAHGSSLCSLLQRRV
jgi:stage III sporulation protein SpoIIIAA